MDISHEKQTDDMIKCIDHCLDCYRICTETLAYCLAQGGRHADAKHIGLIMDCAKICQVSAEFMMRGSDHHAQTCGVCASICTECAEDCAQFGDDATMRCCADICLTCAESCRDMSKMAAQ